MDLVLLAGVAFAAGTVRAAAGFLAGALVAAGFFADRRFVVLAGVDAGVAGAAGFRVVCRLATD
ncbi:MAG: hypothetical protein ACYC2G_07690 [Gemmatimonadaceae bacterium]